MRLVRLTLRLTAPLGTPIVGPTLFGQLCWLKREAEGEAALVRWLADREGLWRISDGFPFDTLPKPLVKPRPLPAEKVIAAKAIKKRPLVTRSRWLADRSRWDENALDPEVDLGLDGARPHRIAHNVIDRRRGGTLEEGGLFFAEEDWRFSMGRDGAEIDVYVEAPEEVSTVEAAFSELGAIGYGRDASTGRGRWELVSATNDRELADHPGGRRMTLSRGVLSPETMADALWRVVPHFGRAGAQVTASGASPFKRPVLLIRPGSTFRPRTAGPFGRWIEGIHPDRPEIALNGFHLAIPFDEAA